MMTCHPHALKFGIVALAALGFVVVGHVAHEALIRAHNQQQLVELNLRIVERAERSVDYAFIALGELVNGGAANCAPQTLSEFRRQVYQRSTLKDIRVVNATGNVMCSAFAETLDFDAREIRSPQKFAARNDSIELFRIGQDSGATLGIAWRFNAETTMVAVVGTEALLFDMLPAEIRDSAEVSLTLGAADVVASFAPDTAAATSGGSVRIATVSERFPITSVLKVETQTINGWNRELEPVVLVIAMLLGLLFGWLLGKVMVRPPGALASLDQALAAREFKPYLQPIFSLTTGTIVGCEVLARWQRLDGSVLPPSQFIPLAEASGRIVPLTWQILGDALAQLRPLMKQNKAFKVSFNAVPAHLMAADFTSSLRRLVADARVSPRQIVIELTERQEIPDLDAAKVAIAALQEYGFKVAIDDAGTGHSGLSYVQKLGVDTIKIDKFFVDSLGKDQSAKMIVEMLVRLAHELGMQTVAEGIESVGQIAALIACGVDQGQGYVVSPPIPVAAFLELLRARSEAAESRLSDIEPLAAMHVA